MPSRSSTRLVAAFDGRRYEDCVIACRAVVNIWNSQWRADKSNQMGDAIGDARGWRPDDKRRKLVTEVWTALIDIANTAHHAGQPSTQMFEFGDARMILSLVAVMSEYFG